MTPLEPQTHGDAPPRGLSEAQAAARLSAEGPNEFPHAGVRRLPAIVRDVLREPMFALLLGAGVLYLLLGDVTEAAILLVFASISVTIAIVQETRSERVLEALRDLTSPRALVIRDGNRRRIPGREVVRGDVVIVGEGDRVPADGVLVAAQDLQADESLLTGESVPVRKVAATQVPAAAARPGGDDLPFIFSGSLVVRGQGIAEVTATGRRSEIGRIGVSLVTIETEQPLLQRQTARLVKTLATFGLSLSALAVVLYGLLRGTWLDGLLGGVALSMSMLPEEFPLVLTVFMVMGAWRISQARVLTRRAAAIETLGAATVLCTDKTGTLTQNRMSVAALWRPGEPISPVDRALPEPLRAILDYGALASAAEPFDPMERAIHLVRDQSRGAASEAKILVHAYGLRPELLLMAQAWRSPQAEAPAIVAAKGAPEAIARVCRLGGGAASEIGRAASAMAARGMRILGVARASFAGADWPATPDGFAFDFVGLIGLADPLRPSVPRAVDDCRSAGIRVVMITGDYPETARAIAQEAGIDVAGVTTGEDMARLSDSELAARARTTSIFARIMPEQKLRIVNALKADQEIVAMTGDGVNDAPSLKAAHIGIAMGGRGTDVAREAAAIVLLDDDFGSIVRTIRLGRRIYDNLRKAMGYILAVHVPIAGMSLLPLIFGTPLVFMPLHIAFIEMVIDPVCSIVFEAEREEDDVMARKPRDWRSPLFSGALAGWGLAQGALVLLLVAAIYAMALRRGLSDGETRALTFVSLVFTYLGLIFVNRSYTASLRAVLGRPNLFLWIAVAAAVGVLALVLFWPAASGIFRFGPLRADDLGVCIGAGAATLILLELLKPLWRGRLAA